MTICGITGPSGSGKGYLCSLLAGDGTYIIDADAVYREMTEGKTECVRAIEEHFGHDVVKPDGSLDRERLGKIVFTDRGKLSVLNSITHPLVIKRCDEIIKAKEQEGIKTVLLDAPLLFEAGMEAGCDLVIAVVSDVEKRLERIMRRDGITREAAERRISSQHDNEFYTDRADITVVNNGSECDEQAKKIKEILDKYEK